MALGQPLSGTASRERLFLTCALGYLMLLLRNRIAFFGHRVRDFEFLPALLLVGNEELFHLRQNSFAHIRDSVKALELVGMDRSPEKPADFLFLPSCVSSVL